MVMVQRTMIIAFLIILLVALSFNISPVSAAEYEFQLNSEEATVRIRTDGKADISYRFDFQNWGTGFDVVDIGMPNSDYLLGTASGTVWTYDGGIPVKKDQSPKIKRSEFVDPGIEVHVNAGSNDRIVLEVSITCDKMVWESPNNRSMASLEFRPTWFDQKYHIGLVGRLTVTLVLPSRVPSLNNTAWQNREWDRQNLTADGWALTWEWSNVTVGSLSKGDRDVGVAFPRIYVDKVYKESFLSDLMVFIGSMGALLCMLAPFIAIAAIIAVGIVVATKSKKDYFRPSIAMPGAGPRTGLTAPEAAMVLELPLNKVLTMIIYGMVKKGAIGVRGLSDPPSFDKISKDLCDQAYERLIYDAVGDDGFLDDSKVEAAFKAMVKSTEEKMNGFGQRKTQQYYTSIVNKAWDEVRTSPDVDGLELNVKKHDEWLPLSKDYDRNVGLYIVPLIVPLHVHSGHAPASGPSGPRPGGFARSYVNNITGLSTNVARSTTKMTSRIVTALHPPSSGGGHRSGGFSGGGCACACACACAGGGR